MLPKELKTRTVGKIVFLTVGKKQYKASLELDEKTKLKSKIESYNKKPSDFWLTRIVKTFEVKAKAIEKEKIAKKLSKKKVKAVKIAKKVGKKAIQAQAEIAATVTGLVNSAEKAAANGGSQPIEKAAEVIQEKAAQAEPKAEQGRRSSGESYGRRW